MSSTKNLHICVCKLALMCLVKVSWVSVGFDFRAELAIVFEGFFRSKLLMKSFAQRQNLLR